MHCFVTGASRGIGWAVARRLAAGGHSVVLSARNRDLLEQRKSELPLIRNGQAHAIQPLDLLGEIQLAQPVDALINCAGVSVTKLLAAQSASSIAEALRINLEAPILLSKASLKSMLRQRSGHIIFLSSILAQNGVAGSAVYSASKAGLEGFCRSLAREVGPKGVRVNCISPGLVDTEMGRATTGTLSSRNIIPGLIDPDQIAQAVQFVLDTPAITGQVLTIDQGFSA